MKIGCRAFEDTYNLKYLEFPEDSELHSIDNNAFISSKIESICLPSSVDHIGDDAFSYCDCLKLMEVKADLVSIDKDTFNFCSSLTIFRPPSVNGFHKYKNFF